MFKRWPTTLVCILLLATGCASPSRSKIVKPAPAPLETAATTSAKPRQEDAVKQFDVQRDRAQFEAAQAFWRQGEASRAEAELKQILTRCPKMRTARMLLAEIYLATENPSGARQQLEILLADDPRDARVHHSLGLAAEGEQQPEQAREHYRAAVKLAPDNATYRADLADWDTILRR